MTLMVLLDASVDSAQCTVTALSDFKCTHTTAIEPELHSALCICRD
jgi:hypothetical protein